MKTKDNKAFTIPVIETNLDYAKRIIQEISNELWNIHDQYEQNDFYTTDEVKSMCQEFAQDLDKALEIIERK
jgi:hypothetical protein